MSYDFEPRWKNIEWFTLGACSWPWMLNEGLGLIIGVMEGKNPGSYICIPRNGLSPYDNEGFPVSAEEARMMAKAARALVACYKRLQKEWDELSPDERDGDYEYNEKHKLYKIPIREDFLEKALKFAEWAEKSGGFRIW